MTLEWPDTLNTLIERARLTRAEFLRRLEATPGQGHKWCVQGHKPNFDTILKMCSVLGCSADELMGREAKAS